MIKQLHPTLKACKCGYIGNKQSLYKHFEHVRTQLQSHYPSQEDQFYFQHGESILNVDDPRLTRSMNSL